MLNAIKRHVRRLVFVQTNLRVVPHSHPDTYVVYTLTDKGPWNRIYTGPLNEDMMIRVGWAHRETPWEAFVRILRTIKAGIVGLVR